jgi:hypothetical protein
VTASRARRFRLLIGVVAIAMVLVVAGAGTPDAGAAPPPDPGSTGSYAVATADYGFGDAAFTPSGFPAAVEVRARVYYPRALNGTFPLVVFVHGRHVTCFEPTSREPFFEWPCGPGRVPVASYRGYAEAASLLASRGYIVASISANSINYNDDAAADLGANARAQLVLHHLDRWRQWATTGATPFGTRFKGHVDLANIGLMGHSRGGEGVVAAAVLNQQLGSPYSIRGVIALAPTDFSRLVLNRVPLEVVLPYCDGDVSDLQGIHFYDDARYTDATDTTPKHAVLVYGADHNYFNSVWTPPYPGAFDDWYDPSEPFCESSAPTSGRLDAAGQRRVGAVVFATFFRRYLGGERSLDPYLDGSQTRVPSLGLVRNADAVVSYHAGALRSQRRDIGRLRSPSNLFIDTAGGVMHYSGLTDIGLCGATSPSPSCLFADSFPSSREPHSTWSFLAPDARGLSQFRFTWRGPGARAVFDIPAEKSDASRYRAVTLRAGVRFTDPLNPVGRAQDFFVRLQDSAGRQAFARASDHTTVLRYPPGAAGGFASAQKLLVATVRIPLTAFPGVDLGSIRSVALVAGPTATGSLTVTDLAFTDGA